MKAQKSASTVDSVSTNLADIKISDRKDENKREACTTASRKAESRAIALERVRVAIEQVNWPIYIMKSR